MVYTVKEKKNIISELILMARADLQLKNEEIAFIKSVGKRMKLSSEDIVYMIKHPDKLTTTVPKDYTKRIVHFHRMMLMMHIDGHVDDKELQLLHDVALKYGFSKSTVDVLLQTMKRYPNGEIPPSELMEIHLRNSN